MGTDRTVRSRPDGVTIGVWMIFFFVFAFMLGAGRALLAHERTDAFVIMFVSIFGTLIASAIVIASRNVAAMVGPSECPICFDGPVGLIKAVPFGARYYRCSSCGHKMKRSHTSVGWVKCRPDEDRFFDRERGVTTWSDAPIRPLPKNPETRTVGSLLKSKQIRLVEVPGPQAVSDPNDPLVADRSRKKATRPPSIGVKKDVANRFFRTLDAIRWTRKQSS